MQQIGVVEFGALGKYQCSNTSAASDWILGW